MIKHVASALLVFALWATPLVADEKAEPSPAALTFVAAFSDDHLSGMLSRFGGRDPRLAAFAQIDGRVVAGTLDAAIAEAVRTNSVDWQRNMALAWTPLMSEEELTSLTTAGAQSPHVDKYLELRGAAGQSMQELSQDLFRDILKYVLDTTVATLSEAATDQSSSEPASTKTE